MFGPRLTRVFASRWSALWWAATILLLAWQIVPSDDAGDTEPAPEASQTATSQAAANPWALATPAGRQ